MDEPRVIVVQTCGECPALHRNSEYPESECTIARRTWGMGYYRGGPPPQWCPLRSENVTLQLKSHTHE